MKTTSYYAVFAAHDIEKMVTSLINFHNMTVVHHIQTDSLDYYVLKDMSDNYTDIFKTTEHAIPSGFFGMRANVDDFDTALENLLDNGYSYMVEPTDLEGNRHAVLHAPGENFNVILFYHSKKS